MRYWCITTALLLASTVAALTIVQEQIPLNEPEIRNANRGLYTWYGTNAMPLDQAPYLEYWRFSWGTIEKGLNQYNFSAFDYQANKCCRKSGCSFGFRYMAVLPDYATVLPTYLNNAMSKAYFINNTYAQALMPDWNDPYFLTRARALFNATAEHIRTSNLTCVRHVDIGLYGWFGEGHLSYVNYPLPSGAQSPTNATQYALVDMHLEAFKGMQLYAMTDNVVMTLYAFSKSPSVGMRRDSLGNNIFDALTTKASWSAVQNRWKQAPFITELYGGYPTYTNISKALAQVKQYHVSLVGNGNGLPIPINATNMPMADRSMWNTTGKSAGFRLTIERLDIQTLGKTLNVNITWNNYGVAPVYEQWNVNFALVSNTSAVVARWTSGINIRTLMPFTAVSFVDRFNVSSVKAGKYSLRLQIVDPKSFNNPLGLAIRGADASNVYTFQSIQIAATTPSATDFPTRETDPVSNPYTPMTDQIRRCAANQIPDIVSGTTINVESIACFALALVIA